PATGVSAPSYHASSSDPCYDIKEIKRQENATSGVPAIGRGCVFECGVARPLISPYAKESRTYPCIYLTHTHTPHSITGSVWVDLLRSPREKKNKNKKKKSLGCRLDAR